GRFQHRVAAVSRHVVDVEAWTWGAVRPLIASEQLAGCVDFQGFPGIEHRGFVQPVGRYWMGWVGHVDDGRSGVRQVGAVALIEVGAVLPRGELPARAFALVLPDQIDVAVEPDLVLAAGHLRDRRFTLQTALRLVGLPAMCKWDPRVGREEREQQGGTETGDVCVVHGGCPRCETLRATSCDDATDSQTTIANRPAPPCYRLDTLVRRSARRLDVKLAVPRPGVERAISGTEERGELPIDRQNRRLGKALPAVRGHRDRVRWPAE